MDLTVPAAQRVQAIADLDALRVDLANLPGRAQVHTADYLHLYLEWTAKAVRTLRNHFTQQALEQLVLTHNYWALLNSHPNAAQSMVEQEIHARSEALLNARIELQEAQEWATQHSGRVVILDTSVFCQHPDKLEDLDLAGILHLRETPVRVIIPIIVIDELDNLKQARSRDHTRWRAGYTLAVLDRILDHNGQERLRDADFTPLDHGGIPRGVVTVEVLFDEPGHIRAPINDDEIISRSVAMWRPLGRHINFITYDTGQALRARTAGREVTKLQTDPGLEPTA
jgi:hypothetical protein